jgi:endonuclease/exonuclease/phosphatase family metal-dependent hydrolase
MKILSLNIWGGQRHKELLPFLQKLNGEIDILCLQEVFKSGENIFSSGSKMNIYTDLEKTLSDYQIFFAPTFTNYDLVAKTDFNTLFGEATYVKKGIKVISEGSVFVYKNFNKTLILSEDEFGQYWDLPRNFHYVVIKNNNKEYLIANVHGFWKPGPKLDTKESIGQSGKIVDFLNGFSCPKILCGDLNLHPNTKSIKILEQSLINLVTKHDVGSTRSKFYTRDEKFADYIFVSPDVKVNKFKVMDKHVSDHLPLYLDFE